MKSQILSFLIVVGAGLVLALSAEPNTDGRIQGVIDELINDTINGLLANVSDPLEIDVLNLNFTNSLLKGTANISDFKLYGIQSIVATAINVSVVTYSMNATINVPQITLRSYYDADVIVGALIPLYGGGLIGVTIDDIDLHVAGNLNMTTGMSLYDVKVSFTLGSAVFDLHGLLNNEDFSLLVDALLNDIVVDFLDEHEELISSIISPIAEELINKLLGGGGNSTQVAKLREVINEITLEQS